MEIEKKYLVRTMPDLKNAEKKEIEQGYLCRKPVVRIRKSNEDYILTYKSKVGSQENAIQNQEVELPLNQESYRHLKEKIDGKLVAKTRYVLPLPEESFPEESFSGGSLRGGRKAELDVFHGRLEGLVFVEVEFGSEEEAIQFVPPEWFGEDVSKDRDFSNGYLSEVEDYKAWKACRE